MKTRNCLALALTSVLAIGCASAHAQDGQGNGPQGGPPGPQPQGPPPGGPQGQGPRPKMEPAEMKRQMTERLALIEKQIADTTSRTNKDFDVEEVDELKRHAEMLRANIARIDKGEMPFPMERRGPDGQRPMDGRRFEGRRSEQSGPMGPGDRMRGPGPSVEQRLAMLERAVREMHEMFERHNVPPEARERAEREMRERRGGGPPPRDGRPGDGRPGEGPGAGPRPERPEGGPPPMGGDERRDGEQRPARPPMPPRAGGPGQPNMDEVRKQMEAAHDQIEEMRKQLVDAQAALKKAQAEIEELRANAKK